MTEDAVTILLPVYGRSQLLEAALSSVLNLASSSWNLLIADDGSDAVTQSFLQRWTSEHADQRIRWVQRPKNLGLFANLNQAIREAKTDWVLLLCSDDLLLPSALSEIKACRERWPEAGLILSTFESINADGSTRSADSAWHHDQISRQTALITPEQMLPALLRLGSVNGNLTGMAFSRSLWQASDNFREDWRHAADWDWLIRAASQGPLVLNRRPLAKVRTHEGQLSNGNRRSGHELQEVSAVVRTLMNHPLLNDEPSRFAWASHIMQFQLWNLLKGMGKKPATTTLNGLRAIHASAGLRQTVAGLVRWLPQRWQRLQRPSAR